MSGESYTARLLAAGALQHSTFPAAPEQTAESRPSREPGGQGHQRVALSTPVPAFYGQHGQEQTAGHLQAESF